MPGTDNAYGTTREREHFPVWEMLAAVVRNDNCLPEVMLSPDLPGAGAAERRGVASRSWEVLGGSRYAWIPCHAHGRCLPVPDMACSASAWASVLALAESGEVRYLPAHSLLCNAGC
eukprot:287412-Rhodomonas_salina.2